MSLSQIMQRAYVLVLFSVVVNREWLSSLMMTMTRTNLRAGAVVGVVVGVGVEVVGAEDVEEDGGAAGSRSASSSNVSQILQARVPPISVIPLRLPGCVAAVSLAIEQQQLSLPPPWPAHARDADYMHEIMCMLSASPEAFILGCPLIAQLCTVASTRHVCIPFSFCA
jgi:hypothetical protein